MPLPLSRNHPRQNQRHFQRQRRRKRRQAKFFLVIPVLLLWLCGCCFLMTPCHAEEIEATHEWTKLGENDTVAAGMHVRMDLTTGERFVKLPDEDDTSENDPKKRATTSSAAAVAVDASGNVVGVSDDVQESEEEAPNYDFDMMHRTLSNLPKDEQARMGGIPELPPKHEENNSGTKADDNNAEERARKRQWAEQRLQQIWEQRQAELKQMEEEQVADLPQILKDRIRRIAEYLEQPVDELQQLSLQEAKQVEPPDYDEEDGNEAEKSGWIPNDIVSVLADLEYHVGDVDMARDFYTLGGWPKLTSLLADAVHLKHTNHRNNNTQQDSRALSDEDWKKINLIQAHAAWVAGTAVKNTGEFTPWAVDEIAVVHHSGGNQRDQIPDDPTSASRQQQLDQVMTTPLDLVLAQFVTSAKEFLQISSSSSNVAADPTLTMKLHKTLYSLGAFLRGNRAAQTHFCSDQGPSWVGDILEQLAAASNDGALNKDQIKLVQKLLALANDIVADVTLHASQSPQVDTAIQHAFSSQTWCTATVQFLDVGRLYEPTLEAIRSLAPHCRKHWKTEALQQAVTESPAYTSWLPKDLDEELRTEREEMLKSTLEAVGVKQ